MKKLAWLLAGMAMAMTGAVILGGLPAGMVVLGAGIVIGTVADVLVVEIKSSKQ